MATSTPDPAKELTRKLFWAVTSCFPRLDQQERRQTFNWAADLADRIIAARLPALPPSVDKRRHGRYAGLAEGRGGGRVRPSHTKESLTPDPARLAAFSAQQAAFRTRAWDYVHGTGSDGRQPPVPNAVEKEVDVGCTDSSS